MHNIPHNHSFASVRSLRHRKASALSALALAGNAPVQLAAVLVAILAVAYIALMAVVMSYGALTVEFSQSVRNDEAAIASLESRYLASVAAVTDTDYAALGYAKPVATAYVPTAPVTALR